MRRDHAINGVIPAASNANHLDLRAMRNLIVIVNANVVIRQIGHGSRTPSSPLILTPSRPTHDPRFPPGYHKWFSSHAQNLTSTIATAGKDKFITQFSIRLTVSSNPSQSASYDFPSSSRLTIVDS